MITDRDKRLADIRRTLFTYLYSTHPNNPDVACWYGTVTNNLDLLKKSFSSGADTNATDMSVIWPLRQTLLQSQNADTFIEWLLEMTSDEMPRLTPLLRAFTLAIESPYCTLFPIIGEELIKEVDPETAKTIRFAVATALLERGHG